MLETPLGNEYLNAGLFPKMPSPSDLPKPLDDYSFNTLSSFASQPDLGAPRRQSFLPTRTMSTGPGAMSVPNRQSSLGLPGTRKSGIGASSSHGRHFKLLGDFFLLSGRTEDASVW